ncbi:MAG: C4-type zinc ribbon domain-containing protein [Gemmatimonadetes bacterium]|nr:C4-type zinc ribbon domain-containing protein [Gemmatimonadota bacterium]
MKDDLLRLLKIQDVDEELRTLEEVKSKYPEEITRRKNDIEAARKGLDEKSARVAELESQQRHYERELEVARDQLKKQEERFSEVTNNREYDALQMEIEACKTRISDCETHILQAIEESEFLREQIGIEENDVEQIVGEQQARIDELQEKLDSLQGEVDGVYSRREQETRGLDQSLLQSYERSRSTRGARVAAVRKESCGACFRQLPPQQRNNVRRNERVLHCENCGAILVWDDSSS